MSRSQSLSCLLAVALSVVALPAPRAHGQTPAAAPAAAPNPAVNIGLVDMERIFGEFYKTKLAEGEVEATKEIIKTEVDQRRTTHGDLLKKYDAVVDKFKDPTLSESVREGHKATAEKLGAELRSLDAEMKEYADRRREQLVTQVEESKRKIITEISKKVDELATAAGYDAVFDRSGLSGRGFPFVVFVAKDNDLSEKVIAALNADAPKTATTPAAPKATTPTTPTTPAE